jgi:tetratricopeptide (TPR) repeat protein
MGSHVVAQPQKGIELANRAQALMLEHREADAIPVWKQAIDADASNAVYHNLYGLALQAAGRRGEAQQEFRRALQLSPKMVEARSNLGYSFWLDGETNQAVEQFDLALKLRPQDRDLHLARGLLAASANTAEIACRHLDRARPWPRDAENLWAIAAAYGACRQISKAVEAASLLPHDTKTLVEIGKLFIALQAPENAIHFLEIARANDPNVPVARLLLAEAYLRSKDPEKSVQELDALPSPVRDSANAMELRASCLLAQGKRGEAQQLFQEMIARFPNDPKVYISATQIPLEDQRWDAALQILDDGLKQLPENWLLLFRRGMARKLAGKLRESQEDLLHALQANGDTLLVSAALGEVHAAQGDLAGASQLFYKVFKETGSPEFQFAYGLSLARQGEDAKALEQLREAAAGMPRNARCHFEYGKLLRRNGQFQQARREFEMARSLDPDLAGNLYALSKLYQALGEADLAAKMLTEFLAVHQQPLRPN